MSVYILGLYDVNRCFGGHEEGGWWYDQYQLVRAVRTFRNEERAIGYCRRLNEKLKSRVIGPNEGKRELSSVLSDGEYWVRVFENQLPQFEPESRPRYE